MGFAARGLALWVFAVVTLGRCALPALRRLHRSFEKSLSILGLVLRTHFLDLRMSLLSEEPKARNLPPTPLLSMPRSSVLMPPQHRQPPTPTITAQLRVLGGNPDAWSELWDRELEHLHSAIYPELAAAAAAAGAARPVAVEHNQQQQQQV